MNVVWSKRKRLWVGLPIILVNVLLVATDWREFSSMLVTSRLAFAQFAVRVLGVGLLATMMAGIVVWRRERKSHA